MVISAININAKCFKEIMYHINIFETKNFDNLKNNNDFKTNILLFKKKYKI